MSGDYLPPLHPRIVSSRNLLMLGKCHQKLKDNASAAKYLRLVVDRDAKHSEDQEVGTASCHPGGGGQQWKAWDR